MSTKGQVILPKAIRRSLKWDAGTTLTVEQTDDGVTLRRAPLSAGTSVAEVFGCLKYAGPVRSVEEMDAAVAAEARRRARD